MEAWAYGGLANSFLSRAVKLAWFAGSSVACMHPPNNSPNATSTLVRSVIASPSFPRFRRGPALPRRIEGLIQITETPPTVPDLRPHLPYCARNCGKNIAVGNPQSVKKGPELLIIWGSA